MRPRVRAGAALVALALLVPAMAASGGAHASVADPTWIRQEAFGPVIEDFNVRTVLFNGGRFPLTNGQTQARSLMKYLAFGTIEPFMDPVRDTLLARVAFSTSDDGRTWSEPTGVTIKDGNTGVDVPLIVNEPDGFFSVVYGDLPQFGGEGPETLQLQFAIYYRDAGEIATDDISTFHVALSLDARTFELDDTMLMSEDADNPILGGGQFSRGPTQVLFNRNGSDECASADVGFPFNCRASMVYELDTVAAGGITGSSIGLAGSPDGLTWLGLVDPADPAKKPIPVLAPGAAGTWDDAFVGMGQLEKQPNDSWALYYAGARAGLNCSTGSDTLLGAASPCYSLGVATSPNGLAPYTRAAHNPATPASLLEFFFDEDPAALYFPSPVQAEDRLFYSRITDNGKRDFFLAMRVDAPPADGSPQIIVDNPLEGPQPPGETDVEISLVDTLGTNPGIDASSLLVTLNGAPVTGILVEDALYRSLKFPAKFAFGEGALRGLPDGTHTLVVSVKDLNGVLSTKTVTFVLDRVAPETTVTSFPESPVIGLPLLTSLGTFEGSSTDAANPILGIRAVVSNPFGQSKTFESQVVNGTLSNSASGFSLLSLSEDGKTLGWRWVAPTLDAHFLLPGPYTVSFLAFDTHRNSEGPDTANTAEVTLI